MRTTLTIDDDIAAIIDAETKRKGLTFKELINSTLRRGLELEQIPVIRGRFTVRAHPMGLKPGIDPDKMNQLVDDLEVEGFAEKNWTEKKDS